MRRLAGGGVIGGVVGWPGEKKKGEGGGKGKQKKGWLSSALIVTLHLASVRFSIFLFLF